MMKLTINGKPETVEGSQISVIELLSLKNVKMPDMVSVQLNGTILDRKQFGNAMVKDNDDVAFLYFMGGGSIKL